MINRLANQDPVHSNKQPSTYHKFRKPATRVQAKGEHRYSPRIRGSRSEMPRFELVAPDAFSCLVAWPVSFGGRGHSLPRASPCGPHPADDVAKRLLPCKPPTPPSGLISKKCSRIETEISRSQSPPLLQATPLPIPYRALACLCAPPLRTPPRTLSRSRRNLSPGARWPTGASFTARGSSTGDTCCARRSAARRPRPGDSHSESEPKPYLPTV